MNTQNANQNRGAELASEALNTLIKDLEAGKSEALKNYLSVMARFHQYSWNNCLLIALQRPGATRVAGFQAWHKLGRFVRKTLSFSKSDLMHGYCLVLFLHAYNRSLAPP